MDVQYQKNLQGDICETIHKNHLPLSLFDSSGFPAYKRPNAYSPHVTINCGSGINVIIFTKDKSIEAYEGQYGKMSHNSLVERSNIESADIDFVFNSVKKILEIRQETLSKILNYWR
jgi:hypothetical protein